jgi:hypothetical protein
MVKKQTHNLREYHTQTKFRLVIWFIVLLFTLGLGLIWLIYGERAALLGFFCLLAAGIPIGLIALFLFGVEKIVKKE